MPLPANVEDNENVARCIFNDYHYRKGKLRSKAFRPPYNSNEVSVIRRDYVSNSCCTELCKAAEDDSSETKKELLGIAVLSVLLIRTLTIDVIAAPLEHNEAHANIVYGYNFPKDEEAPPEVLKIIDDLRKNATYIPIDNLINDKD